MMRKAFIWAPVVASLLISACATIPAVSERIDTAKQLAAQAELQQSVLSNAQFDIVAFSTPSKQANKVLVIYIEGDGRAWKTASLPSDNPTPTNPVALRLAIQDPRPAVAYLARPCQFTTLPSRGCSEKLWTNARFSTAVIENMNEAVEKLKRQYGASELMLIGYSGGGAIATLIAAKRTDIKSIITVAGNLDTDTWVKLYRLEPLSESVNPASVARSIRNIPQIHYVGGKDDVIPRAISQSFLQKMGGPNKAKVIELPNYGHVCCWTERWSELLKDASSN
jgi:pimeloyl-ACP methyl ester carboxylesterase